MVEVVETRSPLCQTLPLPFFELPVTVVSVVFLQTRATLAVSATLVSEPSSFQAIIGLYSSWRTVIPS